MERIEFGMHFVSITYPLSTAIAGLFMELYNPVKLGIGCWVSAYPFDCQDDEKIECERGENASLMVNIFGASVVILSALVVIFCMLGVYLSVRRQTRLVDQRYSVVAQQNANSGSNYRVRQTGIQAGLYIGAFIISYVWVSITRTTENSGSNVSFFIISCCAAIFYPLQGFWNFFIYIRPRYIDLRRKYPEESMSQLLARIFDLGGPRKSLVSFGSAQEARARQSNITSTLQSTNASDVVVAIEETEEDVSGEGYGDEIPSPPSPPPSSQPEEVESEQEDSNKGFFDEKQAPNKTALSNKI